MLATVIATALASACSASGGAPSSTASASGGAGGTASGGTNAGTGGTTPAGSGGIIVAPGFDGFEDAGAGLQARVQIAGNDATCGGCVVLSVQAQGGTTPYTYEWSDPSLSGPGPHTVCPEAPVQYSVVVTDSSGIESPEFQRPPRSLDLPIDLRCTPPDPDAGSARDDGLNGCMALGEKLESTECPLLDASETSAGSERVPFAPTPGQVYQYTYDQLLPIGLGNPSTVDVYMGKAPCERAQKIFTLHLDNMWTQSHCFRPADEYTHTTSVIHVNGIPLTFGVTPNICDSCTKGTPP